MTYSELLDGIAAEMGLDSLAPGDNGLVSLDVDGMIVAISDVADGEAVLLRGDAGEPPPEGADSIRKLLLQGNLAMHEGAGEAFAEDPESGHFVLISRFELEPLSLPRFAKILETFFNSLESWRKIIADFRESAEFVPEARDEPVGGLGSGFMRV